MHKRYLLFGVIFSGLAVAFGAFGAHGLEKLTSDEKILSTYRTGVTYQMYHGLALLLLGILYQTFPHAWIKRAAICFILGVFMFSGSLYLISYLKIQESSFVKFIGPITPIGGLLFMLGWINLLIAVVRKK